jgi:hypothetical protein
LLKTRYRLTAVALLMTMLLTLPGVSLAYEGLIEDGRPIPTLEGNLLNEQVVSFIERLKREGVTIQTSESANGGEKESIRVLLDAQYVSFDEAPFISNGTLFVPFRPLFEPLGLEIQWNTETKTITGEKKGTRIELQVDNPVAEVNGKKVELPVAPTLVNDNTFVPLRFVSESLDAQVEWMDSSRSVMILTKHEFETTNGAFHFVAYGKWVDMNDTKSPPELLMAIRNFNTYFTIYEDMKSGKWKNTTLGEFVKGNMEERWIKKEAMMEEKERKLFDRDAIQLTYVDDSNGVKNIMTSIFFETENHFYEIMTGTYETIHQASMRVFQDILSTMTFKQP